MLQVTGHQAPRVSLAQTDAYKGGERREIHRGQSEIVIRDIQGDQAGGLRVTCATALRGPDQPIEWKGLLIKSESISVWFRLSPIYFLGAIKSRIISHP